MNEVMEKQHEGEVLEAGEITEQEEIAAGKAIVATSQRCMWSIGEWYVGVQYRRDPKNLRHASNFKLRCAEVCEKAGVNLEGASRAANVYRAFGEKDDRVLPFEHYVKVLPLIAYIDKQDEDGEEAGRRMIQEAKLGERFKGEFAEYGYNKKPWHRKDLVRAVQIAMGKLTEATPVKTIRQSKAESLAKMKKAISAELGEAKAKKLTKQVEHQIQLAFHQLENDYHTSLEKMVATRLDEEFGKERQDLVEQRAQIAEKRAVIDYYENSIDEAKLPVNCLMTQTEYKKLVSFCHEDKNIGNEKKAKEVSLIVQKLGKSFHPKHLTKEDLEKQGWKK